MLPLADGVYLILKTADEVFVAVNGKLQHELSLEKRFFLIANVIRTEWQLVHLLVTCVWSWIKKKKKMKI